jgi:hypothetical protein
VAVTDVRTYHGQPVIKEPTWTWEIPCYFFTGGLAGAAAGLAYLSELSGHDDLGRRAWAVAASGVAVSPLLLISDLGRPTRFLNMLRMVKVTSPMSVGSWILTVSGATTTLAAAHAWTGGFPRLAAISRPVAAVFGLPLSTYTAALVANTAVPVWHEARALLPAVFAASAATSAGGACVGLTAPANSAPARRLAIAGAAGELALTELMHRRLGEHRGSYERGDARRYHQTARGCSVAGAILVAARGAQSRAAAVAGGTLLLAGALATRWSVYRAGFGSAADPKATIAHQRRRVDEAARDGARRAQARTGAGP